MAVLEIAVLAKLGGVAAKMALKSFFLAKLAGLQAYLAGVIGSQAAGVSTAVLAAGCATLFYETRIKGSSDDAAVEAAVAQGMGREVAKHSLRWIAANF